MARGRLSHEPHALSVLVRPQSQLQAGTLRHRSPVVAPKEGAPVGNGRVVEKWEAAILASLLEDSTPSDQATAFGGPNHRTTLPDN